MRGELGGRSAEPDPVYDRRRRGAPGVRLEERDPQLRELEALLQGQLPAAPASVVIQGVWGSGKTALLNAACHAAARHGLIVGRARGRMAERGGRLRVARDAVEAAVKTAAPGGAGPQHPGPEVPTDEQVVDDLVRALDTLPGRVILAIDDADRADSASLSALDSAVRRLPPGRATLLVAAGPRSPGGGLRSVDWLLAEPDTRLLNIGPLSRRTVGAIASQYTGNPLPAAWIDALWRTSGGRPLLLFGALKALRPSFQHAPPADTELAEAAAATISPVVLARVAGLGRHAPVVLSAAAALGDGCDLSTVAAVSGFDTAMVERDADAAVNAEILAGTAPVRFTTPLVRAALHLEIGPARRAAVHRQAARVLEQLGMAEETVCEHLRLTEPAADPAVAARLWRQARSALDHGDPGRALPLLRRALSEPPDTVRLPDVLVDLALTEVELDVPAATEHFLRAARLGGGDPRHFAGAATLMLRRFPTSALVDPAAHDALRRAVEEWPADGGTAPIELHLALCRVSKPVRSNDLEVLRARVAALGSKASAGARWADAYLVQEMFRTVGRVTAAEARSRLLESFDADEAIGGDALAAEIQQASALILLAAGDFGVGPRLERAARTAPSRPESWATVQALMALSNLWQGQLDTAADLARRALHARADIDEWVRRVATAALAGALLEKGRIGEAMSVEPTLAAGPDGTEDWPFDVASAVSRLLSMEVRSRLWASIGATAPALEHLESARAYAETAEINNPALSSWRAEAAQVKLAAGSRSEAAGLAEEALALARAVGETRSLVRALRVSATTTTPDKGETLLREAAELLDGSLLRLDEARTHLELGRCLLVLGNRSEARRCLHLGANLAALCGADGLVETAAADMRAAGARPRRLALTGWEALTPAESRVAELAMSGATNAQIAAALYVTEKTVEGHLARVYRKLGVQSRRQLRLPGAALRRDELLPVPVLGDGPAVTVPRVPTQPHAEP